MKKKSDHFFAEIRSTLSAKGNSYLQQEYGFRQSVVPHTKIHLRNYAVSNSNPFFVERRFEYSDCLSDHFQSYKSLQRISLNNSRMGSIELLQKL